MNVIFVLIGFSLLISIGFVIAFIWAVKSGQFDDDYTPSVRILFEDETRDTAKQNATRKNQEQQEENKKTAENNHQKQNKKITEPKSEM